MNNSQLKLDLIKKISQIDDVNLLERIRAFLNTSGSLYDDKLENIPSLRNNKDTEFNDKEDFTNYI
ncbi:hypothetical protein MNBD_BACTEROID05-1076, partial [hydrothermal vent metagenome]